MRHNVIIREDLTESRYGYKISDLTDGTRKSIVCECTNCHAIITRRYKEWIRKHQCPTIVGDTKRCYKCELYLDLSQFTTNKNCLGGLAKLCKKCHREHPAVKLSEKKRQDRLKSASASGDYGFYIKRKLPRKKSAAIKNGDPWDIDAEYMIKLWEEQCGKCYYTAQTMNGSALDNMPTWNSPSIDKVDPSKGYIKGNVVWCMYSVNSFKSDMKAGEFLNFVKNIVWREPDIKSVDNADKK